MEQKSTPYGRGFDRLLAAPLLVYLAMITALVAGIFLSITPDAIRTALGEAGVRDAIVYATLLSVITSTVSTLMSVAVAIPAGYVLSRHRFPGRSLADTVLDLPIVLPPLVMGLCVLIFFNTAFGRWLDRGIVKEGLFVYQPMGIVLVQFIVGCAFAVRVIKAGFDSLDPRYEDVAMTLGANRSQTFLKVVLPNAGPSIVAGWRMYVSSIRLARQ